MEAMSCRAETSYPPIKVEKKNRDYAAMMLSNVGGKNSEMTAIGTYFYNQLVIKEKETAQIFHHINIVEMHHLEIFGQLTKLLGMQPRLWNRTPQGMLYWSGRYVPYDAAIGPLLKNALKGEEAAIRKYRMQSEHIKDPNIVKILNRVIMDEEVHVALFQDLLKKYS